MLIECAHYLERHKQNPKNLSLYGQEKNIGTWAICKMNMLLHGLPDARIEKGDTIRDPKLKEGGELSLFDRVIANPPFSLDEWGRETAEHDPHGRFRFGIPPKVAFLSHSNYGSSNRASARKMRLAQELFAKMAPDVESDGELHGDAALSEEVRRTSLMDTRLSGEANILICPNLDAANILFNVLKMTGGQGVTVGPVLLGAAATVHVLTSSSTARRVVNMTALAVATSAANR